MPNELTPAERIAVAEAAGIPIRESAPNRSELGPDDVLVWMSPVGDYPECHFNNRFDVWQPDIEADQAVMVAERVGPNWHSFPGHGGRVVTFSGMPGTFAEAPTLPLAICRAVLQIGKDTK